MLVFDNQGHVLLATAVKARIMFLALADKSKAWSYDNVPRYNSSPLPIFAYIREHDKFYVKPSSSGEIEFNGKKYTKSSLPTNQLNVSFKIKGSEMKNRYMRQQIVVSGLIPLKNKIFLERSEVKADAMVRLMGENISPEKIENGSSEVVNYILTF